MNTIQTKIVGGARSGKTITGLKMLLDRVEHDHRIALIIVPNAFVREGIVEYIKEACSGHALFRWLSASQQVHLKFPVSAWARFVYAFRHEHPLWAGWMGAIPHMSEVRSIKVLTVNVHLPDRLKLLAGNASCVLVEEGCDLSDTLLPYLMYPGQHVIRLESPPYPTAEDATT